MSEGADKSGLQFLRCSAGVRRAQPLDYTNRTRQTGDNTEMLFMCCWTFPNPEQLHQQRVLGRVLYLSEAAAAAWGCGEEGAAADPLQHTWRGWCEVSEKSVQTSSLKRVLRIIPSLCGSPQPLQLTVSRYCKGRFHANCLIMQIYAIIDAVMIFMH